MGVELTNNVPHNTRALFKPRCRVQLELVHGVNQPPVHGFEPSRTSGSERDMMVDKA